jgi:hypothetical protein
MKPERRIVADRDPFTPRRVKDGGSDGRRLTSAPREFAPDAAERDGWVTVEEVAQVNKIPSWKVQCPAKLLLLVTVRWSATTRGGTAGSGKEQEI